MFVYSVFHYMPRCIIIWINCSRCRRRWRGRRCCRDRCRIIITEVVFCCRSHASFNALTFFPAFGLFLFDKRRTRTEQKRTDVSTVDKFLLLFSMSGSNYPQNINWNKKMFSFDQNQFLEIETLFVCVFVVKGRFEHKNNKMKIKFWLPQQQQF